ncbi:MAG: hypothetical protein LBT10_09350, partial [Methanobrevibacter sp.]|nr:hypothetical protein [Methanobrevibacter sp.]
IKRLIEVHEAYATKNKSKRTFTFSHIENWNELEHSLEPSPIINFSDEEIIKYAPYSYKADEINAKKGLPKLREQRDLETKFMPNFKLLFVPMFMLETGLFCFFTFMGQGHNSYAFGLAMILCIGIGCYLLYNIRDTPIWSETIFLVGILSTVPAMIIFFSMIWILA